MSVCVCVRVEKQRTFNSDRFYIRNIKKENNKYINENYTKD